ncbi:hypothetical protein RBWH47_04553 [Rhodopirellula baltica WH47]|uniref:Uncharacterized protein n=1 Tax=Rhodopirellula baltica WH47 TaxID=991778 RepID=F2AL95_RHOBT|nr:hypothetical protein RBWH47_04553 [Rhodopirellula baltica WH47]
MKPAIEKSRSQAFLMHFANDPFGSPLEIFRFAVVSRAGHLHSVASRFGDLELKRGSCVPIAHAAVVVSTGLETHRTASTS